MFETVDDLIIRFLEGENNKYLTSKFINLQGRRPEALTKPLRTIELRQHRGTLDPKPNTNWIMVAFILIDVSHPNRAGFRYLIEKHKSNTKYTVTDLFKDFGPLNLAEFYPARYSPTPCKAYGIGSGRIKLLWPLSHMLLKWGGSIQRGVKPQLS